jgi:hypothetical protein
MAWPVLWLANLCQWIADILFRAGDALRALARNLLFVVLCCFLAGCIFVSLFHPANARLIAAVLARQVGDA